MRRWRRRSGGITRIENKLAKRLGAGSRVLGTRGAAFLCDYMFNLLRISKMVGDDRANYSDPRVSVRPARGRERSRASNGISMNLRASRQPAIRAAVPLRPNTAALRSVCYYRFTRRGERRQAEGGRGQKTEVTATQTCVP